MLKQSNLIKADKRTLNSYDLLYNQVSRKPFFSHSDWIASANNGSLDTYIDALFKSDKINYDDFREKYNTDYADNATRILALYTETGADRTNTDTKRKETITNPDGTTTEKEYMASDYEYNLSLIRRQNDRNQMLRQREIAQDIKDSMTAGDHIAGGFAGSVTSLTGGALNGIDNLIALLAATGEAVLDEADPTKKLDRFTDTLASDKYRLFSGFTDALVNFETNFTGIRDIDGNYSNYGKYIGGALNSLGEMLPSMLIGYGAGTAAGALGASAKVASTVSTVASQGSFYAGMASANVQDMYLQFEAAGADVSSAAILSNAAVKSTLQWGVEKLLGKMFGGTSLDNMVFGVAAKGSTAKSLTAAGIKTLFKDVLQEGLEEVLQDTSDFLVDRAYNVYINEFKDVTDISLQSLFDAFVIGGLMSFAGSARNVLSTRNVYVGDNKLNKLASWQYGLNLQSFAESLNVIEKSMYHIGADGELEMNRYLDKKDMDTVRAAVLESYAAYRMVASVYESIGEERFKAANEILDKITDKIKSGFFYIETADEYIKTVRKTLGEFAAENIKKTIEQAIGESADELKESGVSEIKTVIDKNTKSTDKTSTKAKEVAEAMKVDNVAVTDGDTLVEKNGTLFIDENKLTKSTGELLKAKALRVLVDKVNTAFAKEDVIKQLVEIYKVYTGRSDPDSKEMITALFYDKDFFSSTLLDGNKDVYKFLSYFAELGNSLREADSFEKIQKYAITRIISNWTESLTEYCIIHPQADPNLFLYAVKDADKRKALSDRIKRERWGGEVYRTVIENPDLLSDVDKKVLRNRVNRVFADKKTQDTLWNNLMSANESTRQIAMNTLSAKYDNLFNAGYDGLTYLTDTSIPNRRFNKFLKSKNLTIKTMLNEARLSEADKSLIMSEFGEITDLTILKLRKMQFEQMQPNCTFEYSKTGAVNVYMNGAMVGYGKLHAGIRDVVSIENEKDLRKRSFAYDTKQRSNLLYGLLTETLNDLTRKYITVDDIINNDDLLSDASKQSVIAFMKNRYGITTDTVNEEYVYLWLSDYLIKSTQTQSIITMDDGTFAIGDVTNMSAVFNEKFQLNENSALEDIFKSEYIPNGLKIKFTDDAGTAHFIGYNTKTQDDKSFTVIDNTIYIPKSFLKYDNDYKKFVLAHELQHAIQFDKHMNHGFADNWADFVSDKLFNSIVKDVRMHMPHLFVNVKNGSKVERDIVSSFVYYGSGESDAYGLNRSKLLDFYPVVISNTAAGTQVTLPWGTTFKITDSDVKVTVNDLIATVNKITNNADFVSYFNDKRNSVSRSLRDMNVLRDMNAKKSSYNSTRVAIENNKIVDSYIGGSAYDRNNLQNVKEALLRVLQANDGTLKNKTLETMYVDLKYSTTYEAFLESEIPFVSISHPSVNNVFTVGIVGNTIEDIDNQVVAFINSLELKLNEVKLSHGSIKVNDIHGYFNIDGVKQLILPMTEAKQATEVKPFVKSDIAYKEKGVWYFDELNGIKVSNKFETTKKYKNDIVTLRWRNNMQETGIDEWVTDAFIGVDTNKWLRDRVSESISNEDTKLSLKAMQLDFDLTSMDFKEFLELDIPFIRYQLDSKLYDTQFVSVFAGVTPDNIDIFNESVIHNTGLPGYFVVGSFKPKDIIYYIGGYQSEVLLKPDKIKNSKLYDINAVDLNKYRTAIKDETGRLRFNPTYFDDIDQVVDENGEVITGFTSNLKILNGVNRNANVYTVDSEFDSSIAPEGFIPAYSNYDASTLYSPKTHKFLSAFSIKDIQGKQIEFVPQAIVDMYEEQSRIDQSAFVHETITDKIPAPKANELAEDDPRAEHFLKGEESSHKNYLVRYLVMDKNGNQVFRSGKEHDYPLYHYYYADEKTKTRKVGQRKWKGTKLEPFTKKYEVKQLSKEFQDFILNAEGLDPALQDKIDGKLKGTLTENEVMSYLRSKDSIDDVTFRAINKAFFKNQYIDSFRELTDIIRDAPEAWVLWRTVKNTAGLRNMFKSLDDREISISTIRDIVLNDKIDLTEEGVEKSTKKPSERYKDYVYQYTNISNETGDRSLEVPEHYMRLSLMKHYDGSIKTMRDAASAARVASLSLKWEVTPKDDRWNQEFHDAYADTVESFDDMTDEDIITALLTRKAAELRERYSDDYYKYKAEALAYRLSLMKLSRKELVELLGGHDGLNNALVESVVVDATGQYVKINEEAKPKARTYVDRMKGAARTIKKRLTGEEQAKLVKKYPDLFNDDLTPKKELYQNMVKNKSRRGGEHVVYKDLNEVISAFERINEIKNEVLLNHRSIKRELELERKVHNETKRQLKKLEQGVKADGKTPHVIEIVTDEGVEQLAVEKEMPLQMLKMLQVHYNNTAKTKVQNLSGENDRHKKRVANNFYENADEILLHLTQADVDSIIDFMVNGIVNLNDATAPYQVAEMLIMTYFIEIGRTGTVKLRSKSKSGLTAAPVNFVISEKQLNALEDLLEKRISRPATVLATWRNVLHQLDPVQTIMQSVARRSGVKPTEDEVQELLDAVSSGEKAKIEATRKKVYEAMTKRLNESRAGVNNFDKFLDKLLQWERLAMLSSPGTWVRNATSNCIVRGVNWTADKLIPGMDNILYKLFPKSAEIEGQYKMAGTSIDKTVAEYIKIKLKDSGLLDLSIEGSSKYDTRKSLDSVDNVTVLTEMITRATTNVANTSSLFVKKPLANMERFIKKAISDDPWVKKATLVYLGKMITEDIASSEKAKADNAAIDAYNDEIKRKNKGVPKEKWRDQLKKYKTVKIDSVSDFMSEGEISKEFLVYVAEAYKLAAYDYMHRSNALLAFESKLAAKNFRAYAAYKQIFPFAGAGWNWFVEGLNYTPIGLAKAVINFAKLENTIEKFEDARMKFKHGEVGVSSDFASYITKRNITKGLIGSIGFIAGALLVAFGVAGIDEEDDKYKLIIGDVAIDISDIFSTQGILLGIAITSSVKNGDALSDVCIAALDQAFMDSTFSDVFNTFRYTDSFGEAIAYQFYAIPNMAIPNILKLISDYAEPHDIKFSAGVHGKIQKLAVNALPCLAHLMPHYYDPYTGEKQVTEKYWALTKLVDKLTPLGLSVYNVSDLEKMAIKYGVNKTALTGRYTIKDKDVKLSGFDIEKLNMYYGQLNVADFKEMESGRNVYKIQQPNGTYKKVRWSQMSEKEKVAVVNRIMTNNSNLAKIYILTDSNNYKYYATESEYKELRALGITKNVYKASGNKKGFIEN